IIRAQREEHALVGGHDGPAKAIEHPRPHHARPPSSDNTTLPNGRSSIRWRSAFAASPSGWTRSITGASAARSADEQAGAYARLIASGGCMNRLNPLMFDAVQIRSVRLIVDARPAE